MYYVRDGLSGTPCSKKECSGMYELVSERPPMWTCSTCSALVVQGVIPTWEKWKNLRTGRGPKEALPLDGAIVRKGGSRSGRIRKQKKKFERDYNFFLDGVYRK